MTTLMKHMALMSNLDLMRRYVYLVREFRGNLSFAAKWWLFFTVCSSGGWWRQVWRSAWWALRWRQWRRGSWCWLRSFRQRKLTIYLSSWDEISLIVYGWLSSSHLAWCHRRCHDCEEKGSPPSRHWRLLAPTTVESLLWWCYRLSEESWRGSRNPQGLLTILCFDFSVCCFFYKLHFCLFSSDCQWWQGVWEPACIASWL